jgi:secretion/DNA translocation related TadE-like protein
MRGERGSVTVAAAGALVALLVCTMGISDISRVLRARTEARTAADAAALAAAQDIAVPTGADPAAPAADLAARNGARLIACECSVGGDDAVVTVERSVERLWLVPGALTLSVEARAVVELP